MMSLRYRTGVCITFYEKVAVWYTLASDAIGPGSTPGGTLELDTGYHPFVGW